MKESADSEKKAGSAPARRNADISSPVVDEHGMMEGPLVKMVQRARCMGCNPSLESAAGVISRLPVAQRRAAAMSLQRTKGNRFVQRMALQSKSESNRTGMPDHLKAGIERLSGLDMSDVRVHANSDKPARLNALAYTQGNEIHLGPGQERHLSHEAWHVVQQKQGRVRPTMQMNGMALNDDVGLEREAETIRETLRISTNKNGQKRAVKIAQPKMDIQHTTFNGNAVAQSFQTTIQLQELSPEATGLIHNAYQVYYIESFVGSAFTPAIAIMDQRQSNLYHVPVSSILVTTGFLANMPEYAKVGLLSHEAEHIRSGNRTDTPAVFNAELDALNIYNDDLKRDYLIRCFGGRGKFIFQHTNDIALKNRIRGIIGYQSWMPPEYNVP